MVLNKNIFFLFKVFYSATKRFILEGYTYQASALTYTTLLTLVPFLAIIIFFVTLFPIFTTIIGFTSKYLLENFLPDSAMILKHYFQTFIYQASHLPTFSIIFLIITVALLVNTIDNTINDIWKIELRRKKIISWVFYGFIIFFIPLFIGLSVFITTYFFSFYWLSSFEKLVVYILPIVINTMLLSLIYIFAPNIRVHRSAGILSRFFAAVLIEFSRLIFAIYISHFSNYQLVYGVFSVLPIFLIWIYICWSIILWGVMVTYLLHNNNADYVFK